MSLNRALVGMTAGVLRVLGTDKAELMKALMDLPVECQRAIANELTNEQIQAACPPSFDNGTLVAIIVVGIPLFLLITFLPDAVGYVQKQLGHDSS